MLDTNVFKIREYNRVSQSVTESHRVSQSVTDCHRVSQSVTECHRVSQSVAECRRVSQSVTECHRVSQSVTEFVAEEVLFSFGHCICQEQRTLSLIHLTFLNVFELKKRTKVNDP